MHLPSPGITRDPARGRVRHDSEGPAPARGHIASVSRPSPSSRGVPRRRESACGRGGTATLGLRCNFSNGILHLSRLWTDWDVLVGSPGRRPPARTRVCPGFRRTTRHRRRAHRPRRTADAPRPVPKLLKRTSRCEKLRGGPAKPGPAAPPASRMARAASAGFAASAGCAASSGCAGLRARPSPKKRVGPAGLLPGRPTNAHFRRWGNAAARTSCSRGRRGRHARARRAGPGAYFPSSALPSASVATMAA